MLLLRLLDFNYLSYLLLLWFGRLSYLNVTRCLGIQVGLLNLFEALFLLMLEGGIALLLAYFS